MTRSLNRNIDSYVWYHAFTYVWAWIPVFFLYFSEFVSLQDIIRLEALFYFAVVSLEVPSGYFSDRVGRRATLAISALAFAAAYALLLIGGSFAVLAVGQCFLAAGFAFQSGTDTAFHYDSLKAAGREDEYTQREARAEKIGMTFAAAATLLGGISATISLRIPYALSLVAALVSLYYVARFVEPEQNTSTAPVSFTRQLITCFRYLRNPVLSWLFGFFVLMYVLEHVPFEFYQPYITLFEPGSFISSMDAPLVSGIVIALSMFSGALGAAVSTRWLRQLGLLGVLAVAGVVQCMIIGVLGLMLHAAALTVVFVRNFPMSLAYAPMNATIAPRVATQQRATYLSLQGLAGRLAFSGLLFALSLQLDPAQSIDWPTLSGIFIRFAVLGAAGLVVLWLLSKPLRRL